MGAFKYLFIFIGLALFSCKPAKYADFEDGMYAKMETNKGEILLKLEFEKAPMTVANFVSLANGTNKYVFKSLKGKPFYDGTVFHRVINDFMIQCGDPTGTGEGGPGYKFKDEFPKDSVGELLLKHDKAGTLSMANAGSNTNGSQFFITHKSTPWLDGKHSVFGNVIKGQAVVDSIVQNDTIKRIEIIQVGKSARRFDAAEEFSNYFEEYKKEVAKTEKKITRVAEAKRIEWDKSLSDAKELPSGLKIAITETNNGETPKPGVQVKVNYSGYFVDGKLFDTSYKEVAKQYNVYNEARDLQNGYTPFTTIYGPDAQLIAGFKEGLQQMKIGDKAVIFIPSHIGYGEQGAGSLIPPNSDLIFELELVGLAN